MFIFSGGLVRNLFAPVFSGGATICCTAFDPNLFWDVVEEQGPTWYYASPSMHSTILAEAANRPEALAVSKIRMVCNAAGGLLPSLAIQIRDTFNCIVLPSYGMTECMPIATPPLNYQLDRTGTSGISAGPEITVLDGRDDPSPLGVVGRICVRGWPVFPGYLREDNTFDNSCLTENGWFDTGDMGYLDADNYLYITGRSKEVINRGGELISPLEVEDAIMNASLREGSPVYGRIKETLIFSAPHDVLQEVVGVVIVTPPGVAKPDLRQLQEAVKDSLHSTKWPVTLVYMDGLPKKNNKILRIKMNERLDFDELSDSMPLADRHFVAKCPPPETALTEKIPRRPIRVEIDSAVSLIKREYSGELDAYASINPLDGFPQLYIAGENITTLDNLIPDVKSMLRSQLDGYLIPTTIKSIDGSFPMTQKGFVDEAALEALVREQRKSGLDENLTETERKVRDVFAELVACSADELSASSNFFDAGGDSMKAGRLLSMLRKEFNVRLPIDTLFTNPEVRQLSAVIDEQTASNKDENGNAGVRVEMPLPGCIKTYSSTSFILLLIQLIPIGIIFPIKSGLHWTFFLYVLGATLRDWPFNVSIWGRFFNLLVSIYFTRLASQIIWPCIAIMMKWLVLGRCKEGMYPMWGPYHTRWWFAQKVLAIGGKGIFNHFNWSRKLYYRLLGAKIGSGVSISKGTVLGEYDLIEIGDYSHLDECICRPFAAERNTSMYLGKITLGANTFVGQKAIIAAGTYLPDYTCIGPNSSSWEMRDASEANRDLSPNKVPGVSIFLELLVSTPIFFVVKFFSALPWMAGLLGIVMNYPTLSNDMPKEVAIWFTSPTRIAFHFLARILHAVCSPFFWFFACVMVKKLLDLTCGKTQPGLAKNRGTAQRLKMSIMAKLIPNGDLTRLTGLFGTHYDVTSFCVRALGGKVGKRVYWPGVGPWIQDWDLVDIGDDVVFGSRSRIITSDGQGTYPVKVGSGCMVADRVVILPGATIGSNTVLGSGALIKRDTFYPPNTVWVGSKEGGAVCLTAPTPGNNNASTNDFSANSSKTVTPGSSIRKGSNGSLDKTWAHDEPEKDMSHIMSSADTATDHDEELTPFGRAFYHGKASFHVLGQFSIFLYCTFIIAFVSFYWNIATIFGVKAVAVVLENPNEDFFAQRHWYRCIAIFLYMSGIIAAIRGTQAILAIGIVIAAKWIVIGRRTAGSHDWDQDSYCQRWQIFLNIERIRRQCFEGYGIITMLSGTAYAVAYFRALGAKIGKDCAIFAGGRPSLLFTEPDLLTMGDRVAVDDASLVGHINTRGHFSLNPLTVGDRSVLRTGSRLLSGAHMAEDSCLLEHTLIMSGDIVDKGTTYQGWPGELYMEQRLRPQVVDNGLNQSHQDLAYFSPTPTGHGAYTPWNASTATVVQSGQNTPGALRHEKSGTFCPCCRQQFKPVDGPPSPQ